ncbi:hypothetical protein ONZ45_g1451 [Pleurotus djamor]|nr:hypothetical protein ONZ45_g1451 [Pleurotus djamor]
MFATLIKASLLATIAANSVLADFAVSQPEFTQCQEASFSWQKTKGPYNILITKDDEPCGDALADLGDFNGTVGKWKVALPAGSKVQLSIEDADGEEAWTEVITVKGSDDASCVPSRLAVASSSSVASASASASTSSTEASASDAPVAVAGTTLVVPAAIGSTTVSAGAGPTPVGAANAGSDPFSRASNSAPALHNTNLPIMIVAAFSAYFALSL